MFEDKKIGNSEFPEYEERSEFKCPVKDLLIDKKTDWEIIDDLVFQYQGIESDPALKVSDPAQELLNRFQPLFKKYITLLTTGQINFANAEQRLFVALFMNDSSLKKALYSQKDLDKNTKSVIFQRFNFIKESYGHQDESEILTDLYIILLTLARRYRKRKRSFCTYVYNVIRYEMFRVIQKYTRNPANIHYKNLSFEECVEENNWEFPDKSASDFEETLGIDDNGLPNYLWTQGIGCSEAFQTLTALERKILAKYYLEHYNDKQIANEFKLHVNTCNAKRHQALEKLAEYFGLTKEDIKRSRNSGKKKL